jgi:hypothetical protein
MTCRAGREARNGSRSALKCFCGGLLLALAGELQDAEQTLIAMSRRAFDLTIAGRR